MKKFGYSYTLKDKTFTMIFTVLVITVTFLGVLTIKTDFHYAEEHLIKHSKKMAESQAKGLSVALWYYDTKLVQDMINSWKGEPDVFQIIVRDKDNKIIAELKNKKASYKGKEVFLERFLKDEIFTIVKPIEYRGHNLGSLTYSASKKRLYLDSIDYISMGSVFLVVLLAGVAILSYIGISLMITNPLIELLNIMSKITKNDFSFKINYTDRSDEIGIMARALLVFKESSKIRLKLEAEKEKAKKIQRIKELEHLKSLKMAKEKAETANVAKSEFLANMSHELRTPLNGVLGMLSVMENSDLTSRQKENINIAKSSGTALLALINDILDFSKIESGKVILKNHFFSLKDISKDIYNMVYFHVKEKDINVRFYSDESIPEQIFGDSFRLKQILINLISNAVKFTDSGNITIIASLHKVDGNISKLRCGVVDTGVGIKREDIKRLFRKFSQLESSDTKTFAGTGLGLAISQRLARMMGGNVKVYSTYKKGSLFVVDVNLGENKVENIKIKQSEYKNRVVLVAVRDKQKRGELIKILSVMGFSVEWCDYLNPEDKTFDQRSSISYVFVDHESLIDGDIEKLKQRFPMFSRVVDITSNNCFVYLNDMIFIDPHKFIRFCIANSDFTRYSPMLEKKAEDDMSVSEYIPPFEIDKADRKIKVLVAEDNEINRVVLSKFLEKYDFDIDFANDGVEAVETYQKKDYDLILMDCQMPNRDGFQATKDIRKIQEKTGKKSFIVALTAKTFVNPEQECLAAGMDEYL
ncbi:MAG: response regulator, partial [Proteobacteria bacterium]|nr:response regulator [Pseudomonadota bacterium]